MRISPGSSRAAEDDVGSSYDVLAACFGRGVALVGCGDFGHFQGMRAAAVQFVKGSMFIAGT